jgi:hypothetical protein
MSRQDGTAAAQHELEERASGKEIELYKTALG